MTEKASGPDNTQNQTVSQPVSISTQPALDAPACAATGQAGGIRIKALAAATEAFNLKGELAQKPAHPLPPCLRDVDRQTD